MKNSLLSYLFSGLALALGAVGVSPSSFAQTEAWRQFREEGDQRLAARKYSEAEDSYVAALKAAEQFGLGDPRVAACLNSLALLYYAQRRFDLAEPLYWRAVALLHDSTAARVGALFQLLVQDTTAQDFGLPSSAIRLRM